MLKQIIDGMLDVLDSPDKWTKGEYARDPLGRGTGSDDPDAVCWCIDGAAYKVCHEIEREERKRQPQFQVNDGDIISRMWGAIYRKYKTKGVTRWNDAPERTYEDIIQFLKELRNEV